MLLEACKNLQVNWERNLSEPMSMIHDAVVEAENSNVSSREFLMSDLSDVDDWVVKTLMEEFIQHSENGSVLITIEHMEAENGSDE
jgi:hypothetical protein